MMGASLEIDEGSIRVIFRGQDLVWLKNRDGSGALAYPEHVDADGHVTFGHVLSESFAHVLPDGRIFRHHECIGTVDELASAPAESQKESRV